MKNIRSIASGLGTCFAILFLLTAPSSTVARADTPPAPRIVRLTSTDGYVRIDRQDSAAGDPAQANMPLIEGQTIVTGEDGQAELEFEDGSIARITPNSALTLTHLSANAGSLDSRITLKKGMTYFELRSAPRFAYTVDAGGDIITPAENTTLRVNMDEAPAAVAVMVGTAHVERADSYKIDVQTGETFRSDISHAGRYFLTQEIASDTWDQWNEARDQAAANNAPKQTAARDGYAGSQGYGWSDLDANGNWYNVAGQGQVWQPNGGDSSDFDPYDNGSWMWYPGSGYLWASSYSWGWTPFRCGNWSFWDSFGWGWSPNGGCGGFGYAGYGGYGYGGFGYGGGYGGYVNVVLPPRRYALHRPTPGGPGGPGGGVHPIITVHNGGLNTASNAPPLSGQHRIGGVVATPLRPIGQSYTARGGSALGASLRSDFPVDRTTHLPTLGAQSTQAGPVIGFGQATIPGTTRSGSATAGFRGGPPYGAQPGVQQGFRSNAQPGVQQGFRPTAQPGVQQGFRPTAQPGVQEGFRSNAQPGLRPSGAPPQVVYGRPSAQSNSFAGQQSSQQRNTAPAQSSQQHYSAPAQSFSAPAMSHASSAPAASSGGGSKK